MPVRCDGFCFLNAVEFVLYCDHNEVVTLNSLTSNILGHIVANVNYYKQLNTGDTLKDAEGYLKLGSYGKSVLNVIIIATTRALKLNLSIYQKGPNGNIQIVEQTTCTRGRDFNLRFMWDSQYPANNNYDGILCFNKPAEIHQQDEDNLRVPVPPACS